jgi:hypothetical protein
MNARRSSFGLAAVLISVLSAPASAQVGDSRWLAWLGCWEAGPGAAEEPMLCIVPVAGDVGVEMVAVANGQVLSRELVRADGQQQQSTREGCSGWERARFSADGRRIYLDAEHLCGGSVTQDSRGLLAMVSRTEWIDVRAVDAGGQPVTGVIHYTLAPSNVAEAAGFGNIAAEQAMAVRAARISAASSLTVDEVIDAHGFVGPSVVGAWIAARGQPFQLDADRLVRMADAGVSPEVIDVVVAISYPRYFSVGADAQVAQNERIDDRALIDPGYGLGYGGRRGVFWNPFYRGYGNYYGDYYGNYYGGGYGRGLYGYPGIYSPTIVVIEERDPEPQGRVVNGRGYTRPGRSSNPSSGSSGSSGGSSSSTGSSSGSSGEGSGSSGGGSSTGRTARPRDPGR